VGPLYAARFTGFTSASTTAGGTCAPLATGATGGAESGETAEGAADTGALGCTLGPVDSPLAGALLLQPVRPRAARVSATGRPKERPRANERELDERLRELERDDITNERIARRRPYVTFVETPV
jgi:hypothetical protein